MNKKVLWYAVNGNGGGKLFTSKPERNDHFKIWVGEMNATYSMTVLMFESEGFQLPELKWSDEPVRLVLTLEAK